MLIYVSTDDMRPSMISKWIKYFDELKKRHPKLKVTAWCPSWYQEFSVDPVNDVATSDEFMDWFKERKDWVEIQMHTEFHSKPPECLENSWVQSAMMGRTFERMKDYLPKVIGWKASYYQMNRDTFRAAFKLMGLPCMFFIDQWFTLIPLVPLKRPMPQYIPIGSHMADNVNADDIDKVFDQIDKQLTALEAHPIGIEYATASEIIRRAIE